MVELGFVLHFSFTHKCNSPKSGNTWDADDTIRQHAVLYAFYFRQKKLTTDLLTRLIKYTRNG